MIKLTEVRKPAEDKIIKKYKLKSDYYFRADPEELNKFSHKEKSWVVIAAIGLLICIIQYIYFSLK